MGVGCLAMNSCRKCKACLRGLEQYCVSPTPTYCSAIQRRRHDDVRAAVQTAVVVDENFVLSIPESLPLDAAAPLLCAGRHVILAASATGMQVRVSGLRMAGMGGLGRMGVKSANAMGAEVTVLSQSLSKQADGKRLGADHYYATSDPQTFTKLAGAFDLIVCTVSAELDWNQYLSLLDIDGALVIVGAPSNPVPVAAFSLIGGRHTLAGSGIGGIKETQEMLDFCAKHGIASEIERIPIQKVNDAYERVLKSDVRYRFVIEMDSLE